MHFLGKHSVKGVVATFGLRPRPRLKPAATLIAPITEG